MTNMKYELDLVTAKFGNQFTCHLIAKPFGNKWVLKVKGKLFLERSIDYEKNISSLVLFSSSRLYPILVAHMELELFQMDVKSTFLKKELDEEINIE